MPLATQPIDIGFSGGLDSKTDPNLVTAPMLTALQNAIFKEGGTLVKRNGFAPLSTNVLGGGSVTTGRALATFKGELLQITSTGEVYSYSDSQDAWIDRGACSPIVVDDTAVIRNTYTQSNGDCATSMGVSVYAWEDTRGGVRASAFDEASGSVLVADASLSTTGSNPRVVACGSTIMVLYADSSALWMRTIATTSPTAFAAAIQLDTTMPASGARIDAKPYDGSSAIVAWNNSGTTRVAIAVAAGYIGAPPNGYPSPVNVALSSTASVDVEWDSNNLRFWILGASGSGLYAATLTPAFIADLAPTQVDASGSVVNITASLSGTTLTAYYEITAALDYNHLIKTNTITTAGAIGSASTGIRSVGLASKLFTQNGRNYFLIDYSSALQPTAFLLDVTSSTWNIVGKGQPFQSGGLYSSGCVPKAYSPATNQWTVPALTRDLFEAQAVAIDGTITSYQSYFLVGIDRLDFTFASSHCFNSVEAGGNLLMAGGVLAMYDGISVVEHGFHLFPENITAVASSSGGSMADGTYGIQVCWYWTDGQGQVHRSAPSPAISATISGGGGSGSIALTIPTLRLTAKQGSRTAPVVAVFRTPANGTFYQRVGNAAGDVVTAPVYSSTTADTVSFSLTVNDASIAANEPLYTGGGTLANVAPGACEEIVSSGSRVFIAGIVGQPDAISYSQEILAGVPVEFATQLTASVDPLGGQITGLAVIDANLLMFKAHGIYAMTGDGPNSTGNQNTFSEPQLVTSDVGTTIPESVATTPIGVMFKTSKGLYMVDRSLNAIYTGAAVEGYNSLTTTSGATITDSNQIRFTASDGVMLVYDYFFRQWSTFANVYGSSPSMSAYDSLIWNDPAGSVHAYLSTNGTVLYETPGIYLDTLTPVALSIQTAWIKLSNLQGFFKLPWVTVLGRFFSDHVLRVGVAYDYQGFVSEYHNFDSGLGTETYGTDIYGNETPYGGVSNTVYQFRFRPDQMKCQSVQFTFSEQSPSNGEGFALSGMTLTAAISPSATKKLPAAQTVGSS